MRIDWSLLGPPGARSVEWPRPPGGVAPTPPPAAVHATTAATTPPARPPPFIPVSTPPSSPSPQTPSASQPTRPPLQNATAVTGAAAILSPSGPPLWSLSPPAQPPQTPTNASKPPASSQRHPEASRITDAPVHDAAAIAAPSTPAHTTPLSADASPATATWRLGGAPLLVGLAVAIIVLLGAGGTTLVFRRRSRTLPSETNGGVELTAASDATNDAVDLEGEDKAKEAEHSVREAMMLAAKAVKSARVNPVRKPRADHRVKYEQTSRESSDEREL